MCRTARSFSCCVRPSWSSSAAVSWIRWLMPFMPLSCCSCCCGCCQVSCCWFLREILTCGEVGSCQASLSRLLPMSMSPSPPAAATTPPLPLAAASSPVVWGLRAASADRGSCWRCSCRMAAVVVEAAEESCRLCKGLSDSSLKDRRTFLAAGLDRVPCGVVAAAVGGSELKALEEEFLRMPFEGVLTAVLGVELVALAVLLLALWRDEECTRALFRMPEVLWMASSEMYLGLLPFASVAADGCESGLGSNGFGSVSDAGCTTRKF
mmetsp:Transcript_3771/g.5648  ORF Transcript_3771/g.5648 Transcript_3771/m.5648 type:complete len:266 (-) Transcript_3771:952-1749(-)